MLHNPRGRENYQAVLPVIRGPTDRSSLWDRLFSHDLEAALQAPAVQFVIDKMIK